MIIRPSLDPFAWLERGFQQFDERLAKQHYYSINRLSVAFNYKLYIHNLLQNTSFVVNALVHPTFFKVLKKHLLSADFKNKRNILPDLSNNLITNNNKKRMYVKVPYIFYKVCGSLLSLVKSAAFGCICLLLIFTSIYLFRFGISFNPTTILNFLGFEHYSTYSSEHHFLNIYNGEIKSVRWFLPNELINDYINKQRTYEFVNYNTSESPISQSNDYKFKDTLSTNDSSTDSSDDLDDI